VSGRTVALIYHDVAERSRRESVGMPGPDAFRYKLEPDAFAAHLDAIAATGRQIGLIEPGRPRPKAALTFDDGGSSSLLIADLLEKRGWRGHFFVTTGFVGRPGFLDEAGVRELVARGHAVGSHSATHPQYMGRLTNEALVEEWGSSRAELERILGEPPTVAAIPGGFFSRRVAEAAAESGYLLLLTSNPSTRQRRIGGIDCLGRFTIREATPPATAAAYVRGSATAHSRAWTSWKLKQAAKRAAPSGYRMLQRVRGRAA
jgi:peptidoglycan/xylan/chitin deacetylase (PgdA/CDA1 family)